MSEKIDVSSCCAPKVSRPTLWRSIKPLVLTPWLVVFVAPLLVALFDQEQLGAIVLFALEAFGGTLPYILFAVALIAWLKASGAEAYVGQAFKGREVQAIVMAALLGGLAPFCSCEVIPFIAGLLAVGAPLSAIMAFWLSSPLIDPPTLLITAAALGWPFAVGKMIFAVSLGLFGGFAVRGFLAVGMFKEPVKPVSVSGCGCGPNPFNGTPVWTFWVERRRSRVFRSELQSNLLFLVKWMALAYMLEALLVTYVPADLIVKVVGGEGVVPIVLAALVGMPAYLNSYVAPPLLGGLIEQGMSNGAAMAFILAGAVSSIPAMAAVWSLVKPSVFATYIGLGFFGAVFSGLIYQWVV